MKPKIPYGRQDIDQADIDAVIDVLRADYLTQGPQVPRFEDLVASYCGASYAVATNSATSALHVWLVWPLMWVQGTMFGPVL